MSSLCTHHGHISMIIDQIEIYQIIDQCHPSYLERLFSSCPIASPYQCVSGKLGGQASPQKELAWPRKQMNWVLGLVLIFGSCVSQGNRLCRAVPLFTRGFCSSDFFLQPETVQINETHAYKRSLSIFLELLPNLSSLFFSL